MSEKKKIPILKADDKLGVSDFTNFEFLCAKVKTLKKEIELMQNILNQNNLKFTEEQSAITNLDDETWQILGDTDWDKPDDLVDDSGDD